MSTMPDDRDVDGDAQEPPAVVYTIDQLAAEVGMPSRTVRHYQSQGLLPPPERKGRIALYRQDHARRLRLIADLQDRGLRLSAIRDVFERAEQGELWLEDWLGLGEEFRTPWSQDAPTVLTEAELAQRLDAHPGLVSALLEAGLVRRQGGLAPVYLVPSPGLLDIALRLEAAGVDIQTGAGAARLIRKQLRRAAQNLVDYFLRRSGEGFTRSGTSQDLAKALGALRPLGLTAVQVIFAQEMERALRRAVDEGRQPLLRPAVQRSDPDRNQQHPTPQGPGAQPGGTP